MSKDARLRIVEMMSKRASTLLKGFSGSARSGVLVNVDVAFHGKSDDVVVGGMFVGRVV